MLKSQSRFVVKDRRVATGGCVKPSGKSAFVFWSCVMTSKNRRMATRITYVLLLLLVLCFIPAYAQENLHVWPNAVSSRNSDPWLVKHHDHITEMRPRVLFINFGNGIDVYGTANNDNIDWGPVTPEILKQKVAAYIHVMEVATTYQPALNKSSRPFISPRVKLVDLSDKSGHANSLLLPRRVNSSGVLAFDYTALFGDGYKQYWHIRNAAGKALNLGEAFAAGLLNEVLVCANGVDPSPGTPADQSVQMNETMSAYERYDANFKKIPGSLINWPSEFGLPYRGASIRIQSLNLSRDIEFEFPQGGPAPGNFYGYDLHGLSHEVEYRAGWYFDFIPYFTTYFRRYADFDMASKYNVSINSLYEGGDGYTYSDLLPNGAFNSITLPNRQIVIDNYRPVAGNVHYPPGAAFGYDYMPNATVMSSMESFAKHHQRAVPFNSQKWQYLFNDPQIAGDNGNHWLVYWWQNMPGYENYSLDDSGRRMKNWFVFLYY